MHGSREGSGATSRDDMATFPESAANVVDTVYTMACKVPQRVLGEAALRAFDGTHAKLRKQAQAWTAS